jgi:hypothetical protein
MLPEITNSIAVVIIVNILKYTRLHGPQFQQ